MAAGGGHGNNAHQHQQHQHHLALPLILALPHDIHEAQHNIDANNNLGNKVANHHANQLNIGDNNIHNRAHHGYHPAAGNNCIALNNLAHIKRGKGGNEVALCNGTGSRAGIHRRTASIIERHAARAPHIALLFRADMVGSIIGGVIGGGIIGISIPIIAIIPDLVHIGIIGGVPHMVPSMVPSMVGAILVAGRMVPSIIGAGIWGGMVPIIILIRGGVGIGDIGRMVPSHNYHYICNDNARVGDGIIETQVPSMSISRYCMWKTCSSSCYAGSRSGNFAE